MNNIKDDRGFNQVWTDGPSTRIRASRRCELMMSRMQMPSTCRVLEIGCGTGRNAFWIAQKTQAEVLGIDICAPFIEKAKSDFNLPNLKYEVVDFAEPNQMRLRKFDYVIGNGILHHLYHRLEDTLRTLHNLLETNGKLIFMEPNIYNPYVYLIFSYPFLRKMAHLEPDEMAFSKRYIEELLMKTGFRNVNVQFRDFLLPGIPTFLVKPSIIVGNIIEKIPGLRCAAQSIFIEAQR
jgi:2-polyprenyl-3-methyl-5-hydroxy-6-metoxy-1,4-benzoquinol methylase